MKTKKFLKLILPKDVDSKDIKVYNHIFFKKQNKESLEKCVKNAKINLKDNTIDAEIKLTPKQRKRFVQHFEELYGVKLGS